MTSISSTAQGLPLSASAYNNRFLFTGRDYIKEISLYDYRNRFYHPGLGRFLQSDPIGFEGDPSNLYRYAGNNPVNKYDPSGLQGPFYNPGDKAYYQALTWMQYGQYPYPDPASVRLYNSFVGTYNFAASVLNTPYFRAGFGILEIDHGIGFYLAAGASLEVPAAAITLGALGSHALGEGAQDILASLDGQGFNVQPLSPYQASSKPNQYVPSDILPTNIDWLSAMANDDTEEIPTLPTITVTAPPFWGGWLGSFFSDGPRLTQPSSGNAFLPSGVYGYGPAMSMLSQMAVGEALRGLGGGPVLNVKYL